MAAEMIERNPLGAGRNRTVLWGKLVKRLVEVKMLKNGGIPKNIFDPKPIPNVYFAELK